MSLHACEFRLSSHPCSSCKRQATPCTKAFSSAANSAESSSSSSSTQSPSIAAVEVSPADTGSSRLEEPTGFRAWLPTPTSWLLLKQVFAMVKSNLWPILIIFAAKDGLSFLLHRSSQRLTNIGEHSCAVGSSGMSCRVQHNHRSCTLVWDLAKGLSCVAWPNCNPNPISRNSCFSACLASLQQ